CFQPIKLTWVFHIPLPAMCARFSPLQLWATAENGQEDQWDVIVVGTGISGLCTSAMCVAWPEDIVHHRSLGGNGTQQQPFVFDSGPSLLSGMRAKGTNPLRLVLDAVGVAHEIQWVTYDGWMVHDTAFPITDSQSSFQLTTRSFNTFQQAIEHKAGIKVAQNSLNSNDE
ncbi:hypothetical protein ACHAW6_000305, partial [Cyclotella cf. meneghiniana]